MKVLAIDPGNIYSGYALIDEDYKPIECGKIENTILEKKLFTNSFGLTPYDIVTIEMVKSYGMQVGQTVFDTCIWIGRFTEILVINRGHMPTYVGRKEYILALCGSTKAKDSNVIQYLIDRFAPDTPNRGKGSKKEQGWFYGFKADVWQAYAIAVWTLDKHNGIEYC